MGRKVAWEGEPLTAGTFTALDRFALRPCAPRFATLPGRERPTARWPRDAPRARRLRSAARPARLGRLAGRSRPAPSWRLWRAVVPPGSTQVRSPRIGERLATARPLGASSGEVAKGRVAGYSWRMVRRVGLSAALLHAARQTSAVPIGPNQTSCCNWSGSFDPNRPPDRVKRPTSAAARPRAPPPGTRPAQRPRRGPGGRTRRSPTGKRPQPRPRPFNHRPA